MHDTQFPRLPRRRQAMQTRYTPAERLHFDYAVKSAEWSPRFGSPSMSEVQNSLQAPIKLCNGRHMGMPEHLASNAVQQNPMRS